MSVSPGSRAQCRLLTLLSLSERYSVQCHDIQKCYHKPNRKIENIRVERLKGQTSEKDLIIKYRPKESVWRTNQEPSQFVTTCSFSIQKKLHQAEKSKCCRQFLYGSECEVVIGGATKSGAKPNTRKQPPRAHRSNRLPCDVDRNLPNTRPQLYSKYQSTSAPDI